MMAEDISLHFQAIRYTEDCSGNFGTKRRKTIDSHRICVMSKITLHGKRLGSLTDQTFSVRFRLKQHGP